jgi:hypothetical protein
MASLYYSDEEILKRLKGGEDSFVERKSFGDWKNDAIKTSVAFANSCPFEAPPGLLCIGVKDDGKIETSQHDLDSLQKTFEREMEDAYPPILHHTRIVSVPEGKFVAVIIPGSSQGPHFSGPAYVRNGSKTVKASREQFEKVIDRRELKVREILKWHNRRVKLVRIWAAPTNMSGRVAGVSDVVVMDCSSFVVKVKGTGSDQPISFPLEHVVLGHDPETGSLTLEVPQQ